MNRFPFVQFELTSSLGPPPGRYLVHALPDEDADAAQEAGGRIVDELDELVPESGPGAPVGEAAVAPATVAANPAAGPARTGYEVDSELLGSADVLVIRTVGAPPPRGGLFGRKGAPSVADGEAPRELAVTLATIVFGTRLLPDTATTRRFYDSVQGSPEQRDQWVGAALVVLNRAVAAYRLCAADPYVHEINSLDPRAIRVGYGPADVLVAGRWEEAVAVPPPPPMRISRDARVMPVQAMGSVLTDQAQTLESEELLLRAVLDLEQARPRAAAVGFAAAFELLLGELAGAVLAGSVRAKLEEVMDQRSDIAQIAAAARRGQLEDAQVERLAALVEQTGALVDHWRYQALGYA